MRTEVKDDKDIERLMEEYGGFHDSCIVSASYKSGASVDESGGMRNGNADGHTLSLVLHSQWSKPIELAFTGVRAVHIVGFQENYFCNIDEAYIAFRTDLLGKTRDDRLIVWSDWGDFNDPNCTYVIAEKMYWEISDK